MPVEIRELVIKVTIEEREKSNPADAREMEHLKNKVVKECIEKVMEQLENIQER